MAKKPLFVRVSGAFHAKEPTSTSLWRIMTTEKLWLMFQGGLWFARLDQFKDPREGTLPSPNLVGLLKKLPAPSAQWVQKQYELGVERSFAVCWHMSDDVPDEALWTLFADPDDAVAVRTTWRILLKELEPITGADGPLHFGAVEYVDHAVDAIPDGNVLEAAFVVGDNFANEREARALIHTYGPAYAFLVGKTGPYGPLVTQILSPKSNMHELVGGHCAGTAIVVQVDPRRIVQEIHMARDTRPDLQWKVLLAAAQNGLFWRVRPTTCAQAARFAILAPIGAMGLARILCSRARTSRRGW
jgi:hypothetical protein